MSCGKAASRVASGTIVEVGKGPEPGDRVIDCRGRTVVPGLIDAHFHAYAASLSLLEIETSPLSYLALARGEAAGRRAGARVHHGPRSGRRGWPRRSGRA
jgi:imidazolonepropionase-like amidohydrolase